jgi:foldase protein PrsA
VGAKSGQSGKAAGVQRLWLVIFGALFVVLFVVFAVSEGIGQPSVPSGDVAIVEDVPEELSTVSEEELNRKVLQQVAQNGLKKAPKAGSDKFEELKTAALGELLDAIWIRGEAEELGISVTAKQVEDELNQIKEQNFPTPSAFKEFLKTSKFTREDVDKLVELQVISQKVQEEINNGAPAPSKQEIADFYNASKDTQFVTKPSRDVRIITSKDKADVEAAKKALEADSSPAAWKKAAVKYSEDPSTKSKGGLQKGLNEEILPEPLKKAIFTAATGELIGPLAFQGNFTLIEVDKLIAEDTQELKEVESQISQQLTQQKQQEFFGEFVANYQSKWTARTFCASGFKIERCANYRGNGHPATASPACYEADPKTPPTECPAPVIQPSPALPGSVTILQPQGERKVQRPRPPETGATGAEGASPLPEGAEAPPPTGE